MSGRVQVCTPASTAREQYALLTAIRLFEQSLLDLFASGALAGTTHTCIGQETVAVGVTAALDRDRDIVFSNHRGHGHFLAYCGEVERLYLEVLGKPGGVCGGRGGSQHLQFGNFYSNGVQGGIVPVATGMALAEKLKQTGAVAVVFLGDGTLGEGVVYEAFNIAALWQLPIVFVIEHNGYAQSTPSTLQIAGDVAARPRAFAIPTAECDAVDVRTVLDCAQHGDRRRPNRRRTALPRVPHLPPRAAQQRRRRPIAGGALGGVVPRSAEGGARGAGRRGRRRCDRARRRRAAPRRPPAGPRPGGHPVMAGDGASTVLESLNQSLHQLMDGDARVVVLGEDILDPYGGAFKVTRGLSSRFPGRVYTTPISEAAIVGPGVGSRAARPAAGGRDHVRRLSVSRRRSAGQPRREVPLDVQRPGPRADGDPHADGRSARLRADAQPVD